MSNVTVVVGPPGTGKTTKLLDYLEYFLKNGVPPDQIGYISFTVKAATEAITRAMTRFNFKKEQLPWFRTLHSLAFKRLGLSTGDLIKRDQYSEICESLGLEYSGYVVLDDGMQMSGALIGDRMLFNEGLMRVRMIDCKEQYRLSEEDYSYEEFERLCKAVDTYKTSYALLDFNDMLTLLLAEKELPKFKVLFVDEAQDLSKLQWAVVQRLIKNSDVVYIAGDDDQAIFRWAGADPDSFINCKGDVQQLKQSYRLPKAVHAQAERVIRHCSTRRPKSFKPADREGSVQFVTGPDDIDLSSGNWLILARNAYLLNPFETICEESGYAYASKKSPLQPETINAIKRFEGWRKGEDLSAEDMTLIRKFVPSFDPAKEYPIWHEAFKRLGQDVRDYFVAALRRGESLTKEPRIRLSTIHGSKGGECENVVVLSDMSYKSFEQFQQDPDDEIRVFYVAATRAKENLYIMDAQSQNAFDLW